MAKKDPKEKRKVQLELKDVSVEVNNALTELQGMMISYSGLTMADVVKHATLVTKECGDDAIVTLDYSEYWGHSSDIKWFRLETDEEVTKRIAKAAKAKVTATATRKRKANEKTAAERAEFERLKKKFKT